MPLHAIDDIGDAIDATKSLLWPFESGLWLRLAAVVFFLGGAGGGINIPQNLGNFGNQPQSGEEIPTSPSTAPSEALESIPAVEIVVGVLAVIIFLVLVHGLLSNFMEFVFIQSLIDREVHVREYLSANVSNGLRLLGFRLLINLLTVLVAVVVVGLFVLVLGGGSTSDIGAGAAFAALPLIIISVFLGAIVIGLVTGLTNNFVVPLMLQGDHGVTQGWRRLGSSIRTNPKQYIVYVVVSVLLGIGVGIVTTILGLLIFGILAIPFAAVGFGILSLPGHGTAGVVLVGILAAIYLLLVVVVSLFIQVPLLSFLRYYAMLVLGDIDASMDPIPAVRSDIRAEDEGSDDATAG
jgi:hypothetical protein